MAKAHRLQRRSVHDEVAYHSRRRMQNPRVFVRLAEYLVHGQPESAIDDVRPQDRDGAAKCADTLAGGEAHADVVVRE